MKPTPEQIQSAKRMPSFIREMRNAIRDVRKTQTRRVMKFQPNPEWTEIAVEYPHGKAMATYRAFPKGGSARWGICECPYGKTDDIQYLTEPLKMIYDTISKKKCAFYADDEKPVYVGDKVMRWKWKVKTLSARYMPKIAARTFCVRTDTRVEQVNRISPDDCVAEGIKYLPDGTIDGKHSVKVGFMELWDSINSKREGGKYSWEKNPWVFCIGFQLLKK